jgi:hypothetical protein
MTWSSECYSPTLANVGRRNSGRVIHNVTIHRDIWQPWFSPTIDDTMQSCRGPGSIVHITDLDRSRIGGTTCSWSNRSDLSYDQQFFKSRNRDASRRNVGGYWSRGKFDLACYQAHSVVQLDVNIINVNAIWPDRCAMFSHLVPDNFRTKLTRDFTFIPVFPDVVYKKAFGPESFQDISGGQREWLECCQTEQSAFCWYHVFSSETHRLQFLIDLDVNATDERIYSVFRGLLPDGFHTLQIFLLDMSAQCRQRNGTDWTEEDGRSDMYRLNNIRDKTLPCGKPSKKGFVQNGGVKKYWNNCFKICSKFISISQESQDWTHLQVFPLFFRDKSPRNIFKFRYSKFCEISRKKIIVSQKLMKFDEKTLILEDLGCWSKNAAVLLVLRHLNLL